MRSVLLVLSAATGAASYSLTGIAYGSTIRSSSSLAVPRNVASAIRCAYNPQPSKARPMKKKAPKEKVKGPDMNKLLKPEQTFFEGPPSITETFIPGLSLFTVVGVIPFTASLARQAWTRYKITSRRIEVASGFQGKDVVQVLYREIYDVKWLRRYGGAAGDIVFELKDGSKLEVRSVPEFDRNLAFIMSMVEPETLDACGYPDKPARDYKEKVAAGEAEGWTLPEASTDSEVPAVQG